MKKFLFFFFVILLSCSVLDKEKYITFSELNEKKFLFSKEDSVFMEKEDLKLQKFSDSCKKFKLDCFFCGVDMQAEFVGGLGKFRDFFLKNLIVPKNTKPSKNKIRMVIGKNNIIKKVEVLDYKDERVKKEIIRILKLPELNNWISAQTSYGNKADYQIVFYLNIKQR